MLRKQKSIIFNKRRKIEHTKWSTTNSTFDIISQFSFLGVILDEHLSWKEHVNMVTYKLSKIPGVINGLKYVCPKQILINIITVYTSFKLWIIGLGNKLKYCRK